METIDNLTYSIFWVVFIIASFHSVCWASRNFPGSSNGFFGFLLSLLMALSIISVNALGSVAIAYCVRYLIQ